MEHQSAAQQCALMNIAIGDSLIVDLVGVGGSFKTSFVGMVRCKVLIVKMPATAELREHIYQSKQVMVKYLSQGEIHVFRTAVASVGFKPVPLLFLDYPVRVDTLKLRKTKRLECFFPARVDIDDRELPGTVTDLSREGCRVSLPAKMVGDAAQVAPDGQVTVKCALFSMNFDFVAKGRVKNVQAGSGAVSVGIKFESLSDGQRGVLDEYFRIVSASISEE